MDLEAHSFSPRKLELLYLRATVQPTLAEEEIKHIPTRNLHLLQEESKTLQQLKPSIRSHPLVLKLAKAKFDPNLTCFLDTKATKSYRRRLEHQPRFSEQGEMMVKVYLGSTGERRKRKKCLSRPEGVWQQPKAGDDAGALVSVRDKETLRRLKDTLNSSLLREYMKEKREKSYAERCREVRLFPKPKKQTSW